MYTGIHAKYPLFLRDFNETSIFLSHFQYLLISQILWKSIQWELSFSCRQMDWQIYTD